MITRIVKKPDVRRNEIINAAVELFHTKDYDAATMKDLMTMLNIAKGTIYHYFSSKGDLLQAVVEHLVDQELRRKEALLESFDEGLSALDKLRLLSTTDTMADDHENILAILHQPGNTKLHVKQLGQYLLKLAPVYAELIDQGCEEGIFSTDHPLECAEFILAGLQFLTDIGFHPWTPEQLRRRVEAFPALVEAQLNAPEGSFSFLAE